MSTSITKSGWKIRFEKKNPSSESHGILSAAYNMANICGLQFEETEIKI
jgi:hypothetical protein